MLEVVDQRGYQGAYRLTMAFGYVAFLEKSERWGPLVPADAIAGHESIQVEQGAFGQFISM